MFPEEEEFLKKMYSNEKRIDSPIDAWRLLFTNKMLNKLVICSNEKAKHNSINLDLTEEELLKFFGLLYMRGALCI